MESKSEIDDHCRTIIHIDVDCFYAQVEMNKNPQMRNVPLGVQQKNIVVTSNYIAREYGVKKCMLITEAQKVCPILKLVNGEDLHDYRQISYKVTAALQKYSNIVERLGLDENFVDVSELVRDRTTQINEVSISGNIFGDISDLCDCGCYERLAIGTKIAQEMRDSIKSELNLTTCAGISHNKILSKIVCSKHKPNQQTVVFPNNAVELMLNLNSISLIPGIGVSLTEQLKALNIQTVEDLHSASLSKLNTLLGHDKAKIIYDLSFGIDKSHVKSTGKPISIGIEDSGKVISVEKEVREKFQQLLKRLLILVSEDGRRPKTIKVTVRKYDKNSKFGNRESRQCNINTNIFNTRDSDTLSDINMDKIMTVIMRLFYKLVDSKKSYHLTLLGLSFTKFLEKSNAASTLTKFLVKDIEVQSITNIENQTTENMLTFETPSTSYLEKVEPEKEASSVSKKFKSFDIPTRKKDLFENFDECGSPTKLRVADLRLNPTDESLGGTEGITCPPNADEEVFKELPRGVQQELWEEYKRIRDKESCTSRAKKPKTNTILNYFVKR